ncbi:polysaccharide deacetylase [Sporanaerobium hydrogeniformans]|uniref:Polysaccharide deacetylase n=2 Tax=Sporanaerobium hydrogeniformans TaxID=3072179 RepID=A0AC61DGR4_9FIRM|nr:polysaccharide deacetylase [Sporanaerobium hydrogeniformans]
MTHLRSLAMDIPSPPSKEVTENRSQKVVYLTFDDGPTPLVGKILDVLNEQQVKGTFFIVGKEIKQREAILKRIYEEGHGIGLHTYSHNFKTIYNSPSAFIKEMDKTLATINEVLGENLDIKVIRFPGGSAGRLNQNFYNELTERGYKIFDWNVNLEDGVKPGLSPSELLRNAKKSRDKSECKIILAHCNSKNKTTCQALPQIIHYYKEQGYRFEIIDNNTSPYYYRFKK